jgi:hypothetical protein
MRALCARAPPLFSLTDDDVKRRTRTRREKERPKLFQCCTCVEAIKVLVNEGCRLRALVFLFLTARNVVVVGASAASSPPPLLARCRSRSSPATYYHALCRCRPDDVRHCCVSCRRCCFWRPRCRRRRCRCRCRCRRFQCRRPAETPRRAAACFRRDGAAAAAVAAAAA